MYFPGGTPSVSLATPTLKLPSSRIVPRALTGFISSTDSNATVPPDKTLTSRPSLNVTRPVTGKPVLPQPTDVNRQHAITDRPKRIIFLPHRTASEDHLLNESS